ncbi:MAG: hypothetical protein WBL05_03290 [Brooklawnia sp.]|uniref:hypothetical protein n=1 Tax=Brooklawnia sp. TaxID=2699740 RepID=UPI003C767F89
MLRPTRVTIRLRPLAVRSSATTPGSVSSRWTIAGTADGAQSTSTRASESRFCSSGVIAVT